MRYFKLSLVLLIFLTFGCATYENRILTLEKKVLKLEKDVRIAMAGGAGAAFRPARALTGTGGSGAVDEITSPSDKDVTFAVLENDATYGNVVFIYTFNSSGTQSSDILPYVIQPNDSTPGDWELAGTFSTQGRASLVSKSSSTTLTAAEVAKGFIISTGAYTHTLPQVPEVVPVGSIVMIYSTTSAIQTIDCHSADRIVREGTAQSTGVSMTLSAGAGYFVVLFADSDSGWTTAGKKGSLAQGS